MYLDFTQVLSVCICTLLKCSLHFSWSTCTYTWKLKSTFKCTWTYACSYVNNTVPECTVYVDTDYCKYYSLQ